MGPLMLTLLAAGAVWIATGIVLGVLLADAARWVRNRRRNRL